MSKRSSSVIILGILAVAGLGLSGFMFLKNEIFFPDFPEDTAIKKIWYAENLDSTYYVPTVITEIPNLNITATVNAGESLFVSFNTDAAVYLNGLELLKIQLKINGLIYTNPFVELGGSFSANLYSPMSLQCSIETGAAGIYNVSICAYSSDTGNWLKEMTLLVYTYI